MSYRKRSIPDSFAVLSGPRPPDELTFKSDQLQILCNSRNTTWRDPGMHQHAVGDEAYMVLEGVITLMIEDEQVTVGPEVTPPYRGFVIRAPAIEDKISREYDVDSRP